MNVIHIDKATIEGDYTVATVLEIKNCRALILEIQKDPTPAWYARIRREYPSVQVLE